MKAFVSYSHRDTWALERLKAHTSTLRRDGLIETWSDLEIPPGGEIDEHVADALAQCDLFIPLISADFLNSFYCYEIELARAIDRYDRGEIQIVPVVVEPCDWKGPLRRFKALPKDGKPITEFTNQNTAFLDVSAGLRTICEAGLARPLPMATPKGDAPKQDPSSSQRKYRLKKTFDAIDRSDFVSEGFDVVRSYFEHAIAEINDVEGLKGRFRAMSDRAFTCTVTNAHHQRGTANITVHSGSANRMLGDIYWSFNPDASDNTANGSFNVGNDDYELFWTDRDFSRGGGREDAEHLTAREAAERLWNRFVEQAGISYAGDDQD
ncbi:toll/interleukin-1 receptor domain-containing protein [Dongia sedimenti]|uniref:Toll/interleukin-1 receptor domain-containing protein n=1 Tax=Dongia sedimenti TaxID=3064282 RepID=A0ABU0YS71_9PROT|nr:toll/interleukin-1 receptor domain-containing protein [Rhodospirillaceae bacterium R-7]